MEARRYRVVGRVAHAAASFAVCLLIAVALVLLVPPLVGYQRYVITGGSMTGTYDRGSVVFERQTAVARLRPGDVITYRPPPGAGPHTLVTHRIVSVSRVHGQIVFRTKGDANTAPDPWTFTLDHPRQARVLFALPWVGYLPAALGIRLVRMLALGLPALLVALAVLADLWREAGAAAAAAREQTAEVAR